MGELQPFRVWEIWEGPTGSALIPTNHKQKDLIVDGLAHSKSFVAQDRDSANEVYTKWLSKRCVACGDHLSENNTFGHCHKMGCVEAAEYLAPPPGSMAKRNAEPVRNFLLTFNEDSRCEILREIGICPKCGRDQKEDGCLHE